MTPNQRKLLKAALAAVSVTTLFPPFISPIGVGTMQGAGFGFLLHWPDRGMVHVELLLMEWLAIGIISALLWVLFRPPTAIGITNVLFLKTNRDADVMLESARIHADAIIRAAEIQSGKQ